MTIPAFLSGGVAKQVASQRVAGRNVTRLLITTLVEERSEYSTDPPQTRISAAVYI